MLLVFTLSIYTALVSSEGVLVAANPIAWPGIWEAKAGETTPPPRSLKGVARERSHSRHHPQKGKPS